MNKIKKVCITGGAGFIGSHLVRMLLEQKIEVNVIDNLSVGTKEVLPEGIKLFEADINNPDAMQESIHECDAIFHLAARVAIRSSFEFAAEDLQTNATGTASVMSAAGQSDTVKKVISASSMGVYSDHTSAEPIDENHPIDPKSPYGISKFATENLTHLMADYYGIDSCVLRLFNTFGPGQTLSPYVGVVTIFVNALLHKKEVTIFGDGKQCRDFVHVHDVANAFISALNAETTGETYNIGTGTALSVNDLYSIIQDSMNIHVSPQYAQEAKGELKFSIANINKANRQLSYQPVYLFKDTIAEVIDEIKNSSI